MAPLRAIKLRGQTDQFDVRGNDEMMLGNGNTHTTPAHLVTCVGK